jgi:hypothetical protein
MADINSYEISWSGSATYPHNAAASSGVFGDEKTWETQGGCF